MAGVERASSFPPVLSWIAWPLGANGWLDFSVTTDNTYPAPAYARSGTLVFVRGALDGGEATGPLGALPAAYRPAKKARIMASMPTGVAGLEMNTDGILRLPGGVDMAGTDFVILAGFYDLTP